MAIEEKSKSEDYSRKKKLLIIYNYKEMKENGKRENKIK